MNESLKITATGEEIQAEMNLTLFDFFKKSVQEKYGAGFVFTNEDGIFSAIRESGHMAEQAKMGLEKLLKGKKPEEVSIKDFIEEHITLQGNGKKGGEGTPAEKSAQTRYVFRLSALRIPVSNFLSFDGFNDLGKGMIYNFGKKAYLAMCSDFRKLGIDLNEFPVFKDEEKIKQQVVNSAKK